MWCYLVPLAPPPPPPPPPMALVIPVYPAPTTVYAPALPAPSVSLTSRMHCTTRYRDGTTRNCQASSLTRWSGYSSYPWW
ncbi:hypothetical protein MY11210_008157 [Beauveria gryllotalpidicola]